MQQLQNEGSIHKGEYREENIKKKRNGKIEYLLKNRSFPHS